MDNRFISVLLIGVLFFVFSQQTYASLREDYPRYRIKAETNNIANMLTSRTKAVTSYESSKYDPAKNKFSTDLFGDNASKYRAKNQLKSLYGLETVKGVLETTYSNCKLEDKDIIAILFYSTQTGNYFKEEILATLPSAQRPKQNEKEKGCEKLSICVNGEDRKLLNSKCEEIVVKAYTDGVNLQERTSILEESNLGNEKYYNGTLDDSSYDIFYDMGQIAKVFYEDALGTTESSVLFYKMPQFGNGGGSNFGAVTPGTNNGTRNNNGGTNNGSNGNGGTNNGGTNNGGTNNGGTNNGGNSNGGNSNGGANNGGGNGGGNNTIPSITDDEEINNFINNEVQEQRTVTDNGNTAYVTKCVVSGSPKLEEAYLKAEEEAEENGGEIPSAFDMTDDEIQDLIDDILENSDKVKTIGSNPLPAENQKEPDEAPGAALALENSGTIADLRNQLESCVEKCNGLRFDEKAICKAKCLCSEYSSPALYEDAEFEFLKEGALRIRICNIPSKSITISTSTKTVLSIETIIAEVYNTIKALFDSGELTPKMKKQEMLDSSLNNIKFSDVVSFNIGMQFKKPTPKRPVKEEDLQRVLDDIRDETLGVDDNFFNIAQESVEVATSMSNTNAPKQTTSSEGTQALIQESRYASLNKTVNDYLDSYSNLLDDAKTVIVEIDRTIKGKL